MKTLYVRGYKVVSTPTEDLIYDLQGNPVDVDQMNVSDFNAICDALFRSDAQSQEDPGPFSHVVPLKRYERITEDDES